METLSIDFAEADVLYDIGLLCGIPWPICPTGTFDTNRFTLSSNAGSPHYDPLKGFATVNSITGGLLSSVAADAAVIVPIGQYRQMCKVVANIRRNGLSTLAVESLVSLFTTSYTMGFAGAQRDLYLDFNPHIDSAALYTLQLLFNKFTIDFVVVLHQH
jgi:hypothetical protein